MSYLQSQEKKDLLDVTFDDAYILKAELITQGLSRDHDYHALLDIARDNQLPAGVRKMAGERIVEALSGLQIYGDERQVWPSHPPHR